MDAMNSSGWHTRFLSAVSTVGLLLVLAGCSTRSSLPLAPTTTANTQGRQASTLLVSGPNFFVVGPPSQIRWSSSPVIFTDSLGHAHSVRAYQLLGRDGSVVDLPLGPPGLHKMGEPPNEGGTSGDGSGTGSSNPCVSSTTSGVVSSSTYNNGWITDFFAAPAVWGGASYTVNFKEYVNGNLYAQGSYPNPLTYAGSVQFYSGIDGTIEMDLQLNGPNGLTATGSSVTTTACPI